jgi:hypothetical protein
MSDALQPSQPEQRLLHLLDHYVTANPADSEAWQDRIMDLEGVRFEELTRLHGELLAQDWIEQNTGVTPVPRVGTAPQCYRATALGRRAHQQARTSSSEEEARAA